MKPEIDYNKEYDILSVNWSKAECSSELFDGNLILDYNRKGEIVGFEILDYLNEKKYLIGTLIDEKNPLYLSANHNLDRLQLSQTFLLSS